MALARVLVVDDEPDIRRVVGLILRKAGYEVVEAEDGEEAIHQLQSGDNPLMVDAILCDLVMPKVEGIEAISYFRSHFPRLPVVVLTGSRDIQDVTKSFRRGIVDYLVKPLTPEALLAAVKKAVDSRKVF